MTAEILDLHPEDPANSRRLEEPATIFGHPDRRLVRNVTRATLSVHLPEGPTRSGVGVIVAPGGGWHVLSIDSEGAEVAAALNVRGHVAFVLEYRLAPTPVEDAAFQQHFMSLFADTARFDAAAEALTPSLVADGRAALRAVTDGAAAWGVDPSRIGFLGFSAGGYLATQVALDRAEGPAPAFVASVYGAHLGPADVAATAPPLFLAVCSDDPLERLVRDGSLELHRAWSRAGRPVELHVYERGGHGFGLAAQGLTSDGWFEQLLAWIAQL